MTINFDAMTKKNAANLKKLENGGKVSYLYALAGSRHAVVAIGDGHDAQLVADLKKGNAYTGVIDMKKGSLSSPGELKVSGCKANRAQFEIYMKTFTKKKVIYV